MNLVLILKCEHLINMVCCMEYEFRKVNLYG